MMPPAGSMKIFIINEKYVAIIVIHNRVTTNHEFMN